MKCNHREEITELEKQTTFKERQFIQTIATLEAELKTKEERYDNQIDRLSQEHQGEVEELNLMLQNLQDQLSDIKIKSRNTITELETELKELKQTSTSAIDTLQHESRSKDLTIENQQKQIIKLKNYIGDSEKAPKPAEVWRKEKETLENRLMISETDKENLESSLQLLNVRLSSMNEVLTLQESELSRNVLDRANKNKQESLLLTRWREKVFSLMVQQKSADITYKKDEQNWQEKVNDLINELASSNNQIEVLSHTLSDKQAQLDLANNSIKKLEYELTQAQQLALLLDDKRLEDRETAELLQHFSESMKLKFEENFDVLQSVFGTLKAYNQRISFASGRVEMLQGLFARRESMLKLKLDEAGKSDQAPVTAGSESPESGSHVNIELERVTKERDSLVLQLKQDSTSWNERLQNIASQYDGEINQLKQTVEELELVLQEKSQRCTSLSAELETVQLRVR
ncbi:hypothetical protein KUTeg_006639 [Tegillarca granosa]|uniref:Coiled-coil alpha-helical rod protein 1 n=1 Tax=Tegillarca granosa TaxID=220873 RepID=A0ABQ9FAV9_TEGGR|nr:hypothetical protein KUTeg_006639 [Tegillarca granosa]